MGIRLYICTVIDIFMKPQLIEIEKEITAQGLLEQEFGQDSNLFFLSVNGEMAQAGTVLKPTDDIKAIPKVAGG